MNNVWGVSRLRDFKICPLMAVAKYGLSGTAKQWVETESFAMKRGTDKHSTIENSINHDILITDPELHSVTDYVNGLCQMKAAGVQVSPEFRFGLDNRQRIVDFFRGQNLRCRIAVDVLVNFNGKALVIDWKTGRFKPEHRDSDALFYGASTAVAIGANSMETQYVYIDEPASSFSVQIDKPADILEGFYEQFDEADKILETRVMPVFMQGETNGIKIPGNHCKWCGFLACPNNKNEEAKRNAGSR